MKRTTTNLLILLALFLTCVSCNKETADGIYKPDKQIAKIYSEMAMGGFGGMPTGSEIWIWENNRLEKIVYSDLLWGDFPLDNPMQDDIYGSSSINFYYNGDKLSEIINGNTVLSISYKGNKFDKITMNNAEHLLGTFTFKHSNGKITEIYYETNHSKADKTSNKNMSKMLEFLLPAHTSKMLSKEIELTENTSSKADYKLLMKLSWNGDNVKKATIIETEDGEKDKEVQSYSYDKNKNPFANFFGGEFDALYASANNITSIKTRYSGEIETDTETITYEYDKDNYPIKRSLHSVNPLFTTTEIMYIEYK